MKLSEQTCLGVGLGRGCGYSGGGGGVGVGDLGWSLCIVIE